MSPSFSRPVLIVFYWVPVLTLCIFIFWQSSYPGIISKSLFPHDDKLMHFGVYALLAMLTARALRAGKPFWSPAKIKIIAIVFASLYGLSDEIHQAFVPSRHASVGDLIADLTGSMTGCFFYMNFLGSKSKHHAKETK